MNKLEKIELKEVLRNPVTEDLLFEFLQEMEILDDKAVKNKVDHFIERKLKEQK